MSDDKLNNSINNRGFLIVVLIALLVLYGMYKWSQYDKNAPYDIPANTR